MESSAKFAKAIVVDANGENQMPDSEKTAPMGVIEVFADYGGEGHCEKFFVPLEAVEDALYEQNTAVKFRKLAHIFLDLSTEAYDASRSQVFRDLTNSYYNLRPEDQATVKQQFENLTLNLGNPYDDSGTV